MQPRKNITNAPTLTNNGICNWRMRGIGIKTIIRSVEAFNTELVNMMPRRLIHCPWPTSGFHARATGLQPKMYRRTKTGVGTTMTMAMAKTDTLQMVPKGLRR